MGQLPIQQSGEMAVLEQKIAGAGVAVDENRRALAGGDVRKQPVHGEIDERIAASGLGIHGLPDAELPAHAVAHRGARREARDRRNREPVQLSQTRDEFARDRDAFLLVGDPAVIRPARNPVCENGLKVGVHGDQPRGRHSGSLQGLIDSRLAPDGVRLGRGRARRLVAQIEIGAAAIGPRHIDGEGLAAVTAGNLLPAGGRAASDGFDPRPQVIARRRTPRTLIPSGRTLNVLVARALHRARPLLMSPFIKDSTWSIK